MGNPGISMEPSGIEAPSLEPQIYHLERPEWFSVNNLSAAPRGGEETRAGLLTARNERLRHLLSCVSLKQEEQRSVFARP